MRISVFGLGYVGVVTAGCLARAGHVVVGIDIDGAKVELVNQGRSPIVEDGVEQLLADAVAAGQLSAASDPAAAVDATDLCVVCVGTPSRENGSIDLSQVERVCRRIGRCLRDRSDFFTVVVRSTVLPGTSRDVLVPILEDASGKRGGDGFGYCYNPEFLREGTAVADFFSPPKTVIAGSDERSRGVLRQLYGNLAAPLIETDITIAETIKYADNAWHALKVGFANEIGAFCKALAIDSHEVMRIFCQDTKLNISASYLRPGFAFGGSCLPKDLRSIVYRSRQLDLELPILSAVQPSNELQIARTCQLIQRCRERRVGIFGLSFKAGTDDLRESPMMAVVERLLGKGYELRIYDRDLNLARLRGANLAFLLKRIPHISNLLDDTAEKVAEFAGVLVIGNDQQEHRDIVSRLPPSKTIVDLARVVNSGSLHNEYHGLCW
jgi:GDP-mannose 6-dehydrogenase